MTEFIIIFLCFCISFDVKIYAKMYTFIQVHMSDMMNAKI